MVALSLAMLSSAASNFACITFTSFCKRCASVSANLTSERRTSHFPAVLFAFAVASDTADRVDSNCLLVSSNSFAKARLVVSEASSLSFKSVSSAVDFAMAPRRVATSLVSSSNLRSLSFTSCSKRAATLVELWNSISSVFKAASLIRSNDCNSFASASLAFSEACVRSNSLRNFFAFAWASCRALCKPCRSPADFSTNACVSNRFASSASCWRLVLMHCLSRLSIFDCAPSNCIEETDNLPFNDFTVSSAAFNRAWVSAKFFERWSTSDCNNKFFCSQSAASLRAQSKSAVHCSINFSFSFNFVSAAAVFFCCNVVLISAL
mmetsp:Transcript_67906/g.196586  ORF Transcript_67906/g.196586 Transcript_67906/m.196586 type:complete len:322 (+) Transcript_67906:1349-2314(+)